MDKIDSKNIDKAVFTAKEYDDFKTFWATKLSETDDPFILSLGKQKRELKFEKRLSVVERRLSSTSSEIITKIAGKDSNSIFVLVVTAVNYILSKYTSNEVVILKTPLAKKGLLDNAYTDEVLLFQRVNSSLSIRELIVSVKENVIKSYFYQNFPLEVLNVTTNHLSNCLIYCQDLHYVPFDNDCDLVVEIDSNSGIAFNIKYNEKLFTKSIIEKLVTHVDNVIKSFSDLNKPLKAIDYLSKDEKHQLLIEFNKTEKPLKSTTIVDEFQRQVIETPQNIAIKFNDVSLNYYEINEKANQLAYYIKNELNIPSQSLIGLMVKRSERMIIALLAILKANCAYVPIDPKTPPERIKYILNDTNCGLLFIDSENMMDLGDYENQVFVLDLELNTLETPAVDLELEVLEKDLAYLIYTSGTTGVPKGVQITHGNIINTLLWRVDYYSLDSETVNLQLPSYSFDSSVEDIFSVLISGGSLIIPEEDLRTDPFYLEKLILNNKATHFLITPSFYKVLLSHLKGSLSSLKALTVAGEHLSEELVKEHYKLLPTVALYNEYGPTENSVCSTACLISPDSATVTIGNPISNVKVYILDNDLSPLPINIPGELYLSGHGVAKGYWNKEDLTKEKFIDHPFVQGETLYRTGDLCRWLSNGTIEFIGRVDHQVKIRGYRVELGEVEAILKQHPLVKDALVIARENNQSEQEILAYLLLSSEIKASELRSHLARHLPDFMAPKHFVVLEKFPLNVNQKINYKSLPSPEGLSLESKVEFTAPSTPLEEQLSRMWGEILKTPTVGVYDNFFAIGGNSIRIIELYGQLNRIYPGIFEITDLFSNPTIHTQAALIRQKDLAYKESETVIIDF